MTGIIKFSVLALSLSSTMLFAQDNPHVIGLQADFGELSTKANKNTEKLDDISTTHYTLSYQYSLNENFSVGAGYLTGDSSSFIAIFDFNDSELEYSAFMLSAKAQYPISKRNSLYLQLNALQYDYDILDKDKTVFNDDGSDFGYSFGWKYQWDMGLGLKVGYDVINLGSDIKLNGISIETSYRF